MMLYKKYNTLFFIVLLGLSINLTACSSATTVEATVTAAPSITTTRPSPQVKIITMTPELAQTTQPSATEQPEQPPPPEPTQLLTLTLEPTLPKMAPDSPTLTPAASKLLSYTSQSGDTIDTIALHFGVNSSEVSFIDPAQSQMGFLKPGSVIRLPGRLSNTGPHEPLLPDSEIIFSKSAADFGIQNFIDEANGYLKQYTEPRPKGDQYAWQTINIVAYNHSVNPRLLLALIEYQNHWVYGKPNEVQHTKYPMGLTDTTREELYEQLSWAATQLNVGYYGWRDGSLTALTFPDGSRIRLDPTLNAGSVAVQYFFSKLLQQPEWKEALYGEKSITRLHQKMFGDPWQRDKTVAPIIPGGLTQPSLELPFAVGRTWNFTGGPHAIWGHEGVPAAIDFAPQGVQNCDWTDEWVTSASHGEVVRTDNGLVIVDLDSDGSELTGWNLIYMHIAHKERVEQGEMVYLNDHIGHPSCEGGVATGTHVHFGRKYNGEWMLAAGPLPLSISGWTISPGKYAYQGYLVRVGSPPVISSDVSDGQSIITR